MNTTTNINNLTTSEAAFLGSFVGITAVCSIAIVILIIIAWWKLFEKAGEKGWKSIIPIYNLYILFKIAHMKSWFWWSLCVMVIGYIMMSVNMPPVITEAINNNTEINFDAVEWGKHVPFIIGLVAVWGAEIIANIALSIKLAKAFGKGDWFAVGIFFFPYITLLILAFGKSKYSKKA